MKNIFLIYGTEKELIKEKINEVCSGVEENDISKFNMLEDNIKSAIEDALTLSLFSTKKAIICENCTFLTGTKEKIEQDTDSLMKFINSYDRQNIFIMTVYNEKLDERKKIVKELQNLITIYNIKELNKNELIKKVLKIFEEKKYKIDLSNIEVIIERCANNYSSILNEVNKLLLYKDAEKKIELEDIEKLVYKTLDENIFSLIENLIKKDKQKVFEIYNDLIEKQEEPIKILVMIANEIRLILQTKILIEKGYTEKNIAETLAIHPYRIKLATQKSFNFSKQDLKKILLNIADLDYKIKSGLIDKNVGVELFFIKI